MLSWKGWSKWLGLSCLVRKLVSHLLKNIFENTFSLSKDVYSLIFDGNEALPQRVQDFHLCLAFSTHPEVPNAPDIQRLGQRWKNSWPTSSPTSRPGYVQEFTNCSTTVGGRIIHIIAYIHNFPPPNFNVIGAFYTWLRMDEINQTPDDWPGCIKQ